MKIFEQTVATNEALDNINQLLPQLTSNFTPINLESLSKIVENKSVHLFFAEKDKEVAGMLTLVFYRIPTGKKAWIEDVVVDNAFRGQCVGKILVESAIDFARKNGLHKLDLTTSHKRKAANHLYQKLGFQQRASNLYRKIL